jgi:hypothetical protein
MKKESFEFDTDTAVGFIQYFIDGLKVYVLAYSCESYSGATENIVMYQIGKKFPRKTIVILDDANVWDK